MIRVKKVRKVAVKHPKNVASRAGATNNNTNNISTRTGKPTRKYTKKIVDTFTVEAPSTKKVSTKKTVVTSVKKPTAKKNVVTTAAPRERNFDKLTGFVVGSDQHVIAEALLAGGETRGDITDALRKKLSPTTKSGTPKPVANIVSSVFNKLVSNGFILESQFRLLPPTPASKRKATRIRNATNKVA